MLPIILCVVASQVKKNSLGPFLKKSLKIYSFAELSYVIYASPKSCLFCSRNTLHCLTQDPFVFSKLEGLAGLAVLHGPTYGLAREQITENYHNILDAFSG